MTSQHHCPRLLIIGWDGADYELTKEWLSEGKLPVLADLTQRGAFGPLRSTVPPLTPVAWTTFMTGVNPGHHGVYDWRAAESLDGWVALGSRRKVITIWQLLGRRGMTLGVYNVPGTFPPDPVPGFVVSGLDSLAFGPSMMHPPEVYAQVAALVKYDPFPASIQSEEGDLDEIENQVAAKTRAARHLLDTYHPDVFAIVYNVTDWVQHRFIGDRRVLLADGGAIEDVVLHTYQRLDRELGRWLKHYATNDTTILIVSDHGGTEAHTVVNLHKLFMEHGWLTMRAAEGASDVRLSAHSAIAKVGLAVWRAMKRILPGALLSHLRGSARQVRTRLSETLRNREIDWERTVAVPMGLPAVIRINLQGREPQGIVPEVRYDSLREEIRRSLRELRDEDGQPVFEDVLQGEDLFTGPRACNGPDLVPIPRGHQYATPTLQAVRADFPLLLEQPGVTMKLDRPWGIHRPEGIIAAAGPEIRQGAEPANASLLDAAPTMLYMLNEPIPRYMEGRVLQDLFASDRLSERPPVYCDDDPTPSEAPTSVYTPEEAERLEERLSDLGYL